MTFPRRLSMKGGQAVLELMEAQVSGPNFNSLIITPLPCSCLSGEQDGGVAALLSLARLKRLLFPFSPPAEAALARLP